MKIIATRTTLFRLFDERCQVDPSVHVQIVPEWVRDTDAFKLGVKDGRLREVRERRSKERNGKDTIPA